MKNKLVQARTYVDSSTKNKIDRLTKSWGMNTSVYLRLAIKQAISSESVPFKIGNRTHNNIPVSYARPNKATIKALCEKGLGRYHNVNKMFKDLSKKS